MKNLVSYISGALFSLGLILSGMVNPNIVKAFLDPFALSGRWNISLAFVMLGAVGLNVITFKYITKKRRPLLQHQFEIPNQKKITKELFIGSSLFGIGWGLVGVCPGPALVNLADPKPKVLIFVLMMLIGMFIHKIIKK